MEKRRKIWKKILALGLAAVLWMPAVGGGPVWTRADVSSDASRYNDDPLHLLYPTKVEDQSFYNYCWAYVANSVLETYLKKSGRALQADFSESDMIQCLSGKYGFTNLNQGGSFRQAQAYWTRGVQFGPVRQEDGVQMDYYVSATTELGKYDYDNANSKQVYLEEIKSLVTRYGAAGVSVYFDAASRTKTTKNGAYYYPEESTSSVNHGVVVVGWNDKYPAQSFSNTLTAQSRPRADGAFLVKNSWGAADASSIGGNTGYYWISYENYFQDAFAVTQVTERSRLCERIYETDYRGLSEYTKGESYSQIYALGEKPQKLTAIGTFVKAGASYRFFANGEELQSIGGLMGQSGWRTFFLPEPLSIEKEDATLELRVEVEGDQTAVPIATNAANEPEEGNVCLKAYTIGTGQTSQRPTTPNTPTTPTVTVTGVTVAPSSCALHPGQSQSFLASVAGSGNPSQAIEWKLAGNTSANTTLKNGVLTVGSDEQAKKLSISASAMADLSKTATATVSVEQVVTSVPEQIALYTVTFLDGGEICKSQNVRYGEAASAPELIKDGYSLSWDCAFTSVTGNMLVNAVWTKQEDSGGQPDSPVAAIATINKNLYTCWRDGTAQYTKCKANNRITINIPEAIRQDDVTYIVTELKAKCASKNKKVRTVNIGKNATKIGAKAFYGCKKLTKVKIKSEKIISIGASAFSGIAKKASVYVPRSRLAEYRAMVRESGNKTARVRAYD